MNTFTLNAFDKSDLVSIARHIGAYRGDDARTKKAEFVEILAAAPADIVRQAIVDLGIMPIEEAEFIEKDATAAARNSAAAVDGDPADILAATIRQIAGGAVNAETVRQIVADELSGIMDMVREAAAAASGFTRVEIRNDQGELRKLDGIHHKHFPKLLKVCGARTASGSRMNVWLTGPAGTGKTTAAEKAAEALGLDYAAIGTSDNKYEVTGFTDANGRIVDTTFKRLYRDGGVLLLDEIDGWYPNALLALNAALANGYALFPEGMVKRHADCVIICAANTYGLGGTNDYVGRMKQDAAFLDRFVFIDWPIDEALERALTGNDEWCSKVQTYRTRVSALGIKVLITPRASINGAALLAAGFDMDEVIDMTVRKGMTDDQWRQVSAK